MEVPFPFVANHVSLPTGHYKLISSDSSLILIDANTGRGQAILVIRREFSDSSNARMTFVKSGTRLVLTQVRSRVVAQGPKANDTTIELAMR